MSKNQFPKREEDPGRYYHYDKNLEARVQELESKVSRMQQFLETELDYLGWASLEAASLSSCWKVLRRLIFGDR